MMKTLAHELIRTKALRFGNFETKSGRISPYFINTGNLYESLILRQIAEKTAMILADQKISDVDFFGPAYKGIALAAAACMNLSQAMPKSRFAFFRKEKKQHGEGGTLVGSLRDGKPLVIIEDVLTGGTALRQTHGELKQAFPNRSTACVIIVLDREEVGQKISAKKEVEALYGCPCFCITNVSSLISEIDSWKEKPPGYNREAIESYRQKYGSK